LSLGRLEEVIASVDIDTLRGQEIYTREATAQYGTSGALQLRMIAKKTPRSIGPNADLDKGRKPAAR